MDNRLREDDGGGGAAASAGRPAFAGFADAAQAGGGTDAPEQRAAVPAGAATARREGYRAVRGVGHAEKVSVPFNAIIITGTDRTSKKWNSGRRTIP
ncbi:hypothetical protein [Kaistia terrae]|uniref:Uncharacterized protein n=1 Tax=Kaistia terrae TaxID=537017 RepID=A0ABW0Q422_9HYPH|nr:hypothetical protein [Kaistia terrae]